MVVLDTNVLSKLMRPAPSEAVVRWVAGRNGASLYTTTVTQAEILFGLALLPEGRRRNDLMAAAEMMFEEDFFGRVLTFDGTAAVMFASIAAGRHRKGKPTSTFDAQIAAICRAQGAVLATRNTADFQDCGIALMNPWEA
ncbi:type II toxin-antitoxin system VapC family toxin [Skermanella rosea]|uniref:type II toxin-antitoxin system VapC family toxin n=1 Tax=Skermanella rosea TaxID=1817965 RepID=UPI001933D8F0|nr:type II toxin-antitoxin system VapC family toxin [Skermanella rosea]UEM01336.1 type II toxin-antitoxin system VapC family toxin [Skermanella rosea]